MTRVNNKRLGQVLAAGVLIVAAGTGAAVAGGRTTSVKRNTFRDADALTADALMDRIQSQAERR